MTAPGAALIVIAKAPVPGRSKTRLCPPCTPGQAAALAAAALRDTLAAALAAPADRRILALDGAPGPWLPRGFEVFPQPAGGLDVRIAAAFAVAGGPALLIGMDTPHVPVRWLARGLQAIGFGGDDAVLGPSPDGGYWALGLRRPDPRAVLGVPMSTVSTGQAQRDRLGRLGLSCRELPALRDVDRFPDAVAAAAAMAPESSFPRAVADLGAGLEAAA